MAFREASHQYTASTLSVTAAPMTSHVTPWVCEGKPLDTMSHNEPEDSLGWLFYLMTGTKERHELWNVVVKF